MIKSQMLYRLSYGLFKESDTCATWLRASPNGP